MKISYRAPAMPRDMLMAWLDSWGTDALLPIRRAVDWGAFTNAPIYVVRRDAEIEARVLFAELTTIGRAAADVHDAADRLIAEYRSQLLDARTDAAMLRRENDAMRQLFQVWLMVDSLPSEARAELERRTSALGGEVVRGD